MKQFISILVFTLLVPSLVFGGQLGNESIQAPTATTPVFSTTALEPKQPMLLAHVTDADRAAMRCTEEAKTQKSHSWDNFVDVHFGGYRWAWWALAGGVLIAIHAGAD